MPIDPNSFIFGQPPANQPWPTLAGTLANLFPPQQQQAQSPNVWGNLLSQFGQSSPPVSSSSLPSGNAGAVELYIRQAAAQRGIDPDIAVRVARSEGLNSYIGDAGSSFGPFQLHYGGMASGGNAGGGLGDVFTRQTGLSAQDPSTVKQQVDFALDQAKQGGWGPWHGWKGDPWAGIGNQ